MLCFFYCVHDYVVTKAMAHSGASDVSKTSEWAALIKDETKTIKKPRKMSSFLNLWPSAKLFNLLTATVLRRLSLTKKIGIRLLFER